MKKVLILSLTTLIVLSCCGCSSKNPLKPGETALSAYDSFVSSILTGRVKKYCVDFTSFFGVISMTCDEAHVGINDDGSRAMLFRERCPFVFWHYPDYDYYNGHTYYYKYGGNWYADSYDHRTLRSKNGYYSAIDDGLRQYRVFQNEIKRRLFGGYNIVVCGVSPDGGRLYRLEARADSCLCFDRAILYRYRLDEESDKFILAGATYIKYKDINSIYDIDIPDDFRFPAQI